MSQLRKNDGDEVKQGSHSGRGRGKQSRLVIHLAAVATVVTAFALAAPGQATVIQVDYTGVVSSVGSDLVGGPIAVGNDITGRFVYHTPAPNVGGGAIGLYEDVVTSFAVTAGGYDVALVGSTDFRVGNDQTSIPNPFDSLIVNANALSGQELNGLSPVRLQFGLYSIDLDKVLSTNLPEIDGLLRFDASDGRTNFNFLTFGSGFERQVRWSFTSYTPTVIPEPGTALLLGCGLMALSIKGRSA